MNFGKTYACTPDGIHFQKPVQLVIHYADTMAKGITTSIPVIRWQDKTGRWSSVEKIHLDSVAHTLGGGIEHFSNYSAGMSFKIIPRERKLRIGGRYELQLLISLNNPKGKGVHSYLATDADFWKTSSIEWYVNDVSGGNDAVGRIEPASSTEPNIATYIAPGRLPVSAVTIKAKYKGLVPVGPDAYTDNAMTLARVDLYDEFHYMFMGKDQVGHLEMIDASSCDIRAFSSGKIEMTNIQNNPPWSDWPASIGKCSYTYPDKTSWKGLVQIEGMINGRYDAPSSPSGGTAANGWIHIQLTMAMGSSPPYTARCKGGGARTVQSAPVMAMPRTIDLELLANDEVMIHFGPESKLGMLEVNRGGQGFKITASRNP
jgi:hypothetical protein